MSPRPGRVRLEFSDDDEEFGHLIRYDDAHNDPPAELADEARAWIKANVPSTRIDYGDPALSVVLVFREQVHADRFRARFAKAA